MDGMSCLQTMNHLDKSGHLWIRSPVYKQ